MINEHFESKRFHFQEFQSNYLESKARKTMLQLSEQFKLNFNE